MYTDQLVIFTAKLLRNEAGESVGAVVGITEPNAILRRFQAIKVQTRNLHHTIITGADNAYLYAPHKGQGTEITQFTPSTEQFEQLGDFNYTEDEVLQFSDQNDVLVAADVTWISGLNMAFVTKVPTRINWWSKLTP